MDIVELGLFYDAEIEGPNVKVQYTLTSMGCPAGAMIQEDIERVVGEIPGVEDGFERAHVRAAVVAGEDVRRRQVHPRLRLSRAQARHTSRKPIGATGRTSRFRSPNGLTTKEGEWGTASHRSRAGRRP